MTKDQDEGKSKLNKDEPQINRGVELLLRNRGRRSEKPKTFQVEKLKKWYADYRYVLHINSDSFNVVRK